MTILAGEKVTAARLGRLQSQEYHVAATGDLAGAATNADVPGASITFTTEAANATYTAIAVFDVDLTGATTSTGTGRIAVDGVAATATANFGQEVATDRITVPQTYSGTLASAGSHTIKLIGSPAANQSIRSSNSTLLIRVKEVV